MTDHALIRYFERVLQLDVEAIRNTILTKEHLVQIKSGAENDIKLAPGVTAIIRNQKVVTIK